LTGLEPNRIRRVRIRRRASHIGRMIDDRYPYRWQDHVITPGHAAASLVATALVAIVVGGAALAHDGHADTPRPAVAHVATERTPTLAQIAKPPVLPHPSGDWM
jgi:hypothetical protein